MTDERDICERLEDQSIDGAIYLRLNAAKDIRALRHYVARLEHDLAKAETDLEKAWAYSSKQAVDIVTLGQEVGRLREALTKIIRQHERFVPDDELGDLHYQGGLEVCFDIARAALAEKEEK